MTGQITGRTATSDGWPLPGATVTLIGSDGRQIGRATADTTGRFAVPVDATGPATVIVAAAGLDPVARRVSLPDPDLGTIVLQAAGHDRLPSPGTWTIDPAHSIVRATARHLGMSRVEGRFTELSGTITVTDPIESSHVTVVIEAASIDTGSRDRDTHLRSPDFLDVKQFPTLRYRSSGLTRLSDDHWQLDGGLTIRDITRPVALDVHYGGSGPDPWGGTRMAATATTQLHRSDYEINWNMGLPGGLTLIGPTLRVELDIQAVLQT
ncbi:MAG TPA: YceI family protein [Actinoplanes sp.]